MAGADHRQDQQIGKGSVTMKKVIVILLAAALLIGMALAEDQLFTKPLEEMSLEELTEASLRISNEITARYGKIEGMVIEPGMYIVGEDIPEGSYYFEGVPGRLSTSLSVYPSIDKTKTLDAIQYVYGIGDTTPKSGRIILKNGYVIEFVQGPAVIHIYKGLMD
jgi:hypothetical protein